MPKLYLFYKIPPKSQIDNDDIPLSDRFQLYACTDNKVLAQEFMEFRNMDKFILKKRKLNKAEMIEFLNRHSSTRLEVYSFLTSEWVEDKKSNGQKYRSRDWYNVRVTATWSEKEQCSEIIEQGMSAAQIEYSNPFILKAKYLKALSDMEYINIYKLCGRRTKGIYQTDYTEGIEEFIERLEDFTGPEVTIDELKIFFMVAKGTIK